MFSSLVTIRALCFMALTTARTTSKPQTTRDRSDPMPAVILWESCYGEIVPQVERHPWPAVCKSASHMSERFTQPHETAAQPTNSAYRRDCQRRGARVRRAAKSCPLSLFVHLPVDLIRLEPHRPPTTPRARPGVPQIEWASAGPERTPRYDRRVSGPLNAESKLNWRVAHR